MPIEAAARTTRAPRFASLFRIKLLLGILGAGGIVIALMTVLLHDLMLRAVVDSLTANMSASAVGLAVGLDTTDIVGLARAGPADADPVRRLRVQASVADAANRVIREYRHDPILRVEDTNPPTLHLVLRAPDGAGWVAASTDPSRIDLRVDPRSFEQPDGFVLGAEPWEYIGADAGDLPASTPGRLRGWAPVRDHAGASVGLFVVEADRDIFGGFAASLVTAARTIFGVFMGGLLILGTAFAWWATRPLQRLSDGMAAVARGDLTVSLPARRRLDGAHELLERFNQMVRGLNERERMRRSLADASLVQQHLLPSSLPDIPGYQMLSSVVYCDQTGGDYVDCIPLAPDPAASTADRWGLAVGDISGHGIPAAMLMSWTRALLRSQAFAFRDEPHELLRLLNRHFARDARDGMFLTLFYAVLAPDTATLRWSSAGHEPGFLVRPHTRTITTLDSQDIPLGVNDDLGFPASAVVRLEPGDLLYLGTDGISQCHDPRGRELGLQRLRTLLVELAGAPLPTIRDAINSAVAAHRAGAPPEDDLTFMLVRRSADAAGPR